MSILTKHNTSTAQDIFDSIIHEIQYALTIAKTVEGSSAVQSATKLFPAIGDIVGRITALTGEATSLVGAIPALEQAFVILKDLGARPNEDLDNVGPGRTGATG